MPFESNPGSLDKESYSRQKGVPWTFESRLVPLFLPWRVGAHMYRRPREDVCGKLWTRGGAFAEGSLCRFTDTLFV